MRVGSAESAGGRLGAVLAAPRSGVVSLGRSGPWLATTPASAKQVLTDPAHFDFPGDVSRSGDLSASRGDTRSGHLVFDALSPDQVAGGVEVFEREWAAALAAHERTTPHAPYDAMTLLRVPVARSTTAAVLGSADSAQRDRVAGQVLAWIDALAPVIAARRPPAGWTRTRRAERRARRALEETLAQVPGVDPAPVATLLAAGIQVPIAAGAWLLAWLADHATGDVDPLHAVWETLRLTPPTWVTARITTADVDLADERIPSGSVVMVSPLLLGRLESLVPGDPAGLGDFDPDRWRDGARRPGAWLPFGAGPHACPGRTLGLAQLLCVARWAVTRELELSEPVTIDQSRGITPAPCRFRVAPRREAPQ
ncbi:cytochrome P450 [Nocardioides sp. SYSU D00065]|uniref:cytochrome P450 n=1 Tax=Nocardioides sp. SYSU D00065 TaxID=2817378 RepID=UPI001B31F675|nr:cytochrome P450 [Nocardioides sp. SYSU D00065]